MTTKDWHQKPEKQSPKGIENGKEKFKKTQDTKLCLLTYDATREDRK